MSRVCIFTGKRPNVANKVSHSNIKTKKRQLPNLQTRKLWSSGLNRFVTIRLSTAAIRTISIKGLDSWANELGIDLSAH
jgi:large subunit ribosomal protein L28